MGDSSIMGPGSTNHKTRVVVCKTYISFSVEAEDGRDTRCGANRAQGNWIAGACECRLQGFLGDSRGAHGVFADRVKTGYKNNSPPSNEGGLEGGEIGTMGPIHPYCSLCGGVGKSDTEAPRILLIQVKYAYTHSIINVISLVIITIWYNLSYDSFDFRLASRVAS